MMFPAEATPNGAYGPFDMANPAAAVIDAHGTVIGWTGAAERLLGYPAAEILDRPAARLLAGPEDASRAAAIVDECRSRDSWGGLVGARHRDGRRIDVGLRVCAMSDTEDRKAWLVSAIDLTKSPSWAVSGSVLEGFLTRSPLGMAVLSPDLRYVWMNDTAGCRARSGWAAG
jgi:PAS domain S-box-containing protein